LQLIASMNRKEKILFLNSIIRGTRSIAEVQLPNVKIQIGTQGVRYINENTLKELTSAELNRFKHFIRGAKKIKFHVNIL